MVDLIITQILTGIGAAGILLLMAVGLSLVFGVLHILDFVHGSIFLFGGYIGYTFSILLARVEGGFWLSLVAGGLMAAALGTLIEILFLRRVYDRQLLLQFLILFGVVYIVSDVMKIFWGTGYLSISRPDFLSDSMSYAGGRVVVARYNIFVIVLGAATIALLWLLMNRTRFGLQVRALHQQKEMAALLGMNTPMLRTSVFAIGSGMAGLAGVAIGGLGSLSPGMDVEAVILAFSIVTIGGLGSVKGAIVGALIVGLVQCLGLLILPQLNITFIYLVMAVVLVVRPWGLFGRATA
ncbi:MAG TPA: branched-chain amino acid ABC transporter permease [Thermodesulfobacteriota bacterium]|nr:branched-chain amino acid ABC transporter permease [Thermodesulfobacteriota bacterium]